MNSATNDNIFARASSGQRNYVKVLMDHAEVLILHENQAGAIATRRLGGCSGIVILGRTAANMAHIAPLPPRQSRNEGGPGTARQGLSDSEQHFLHILRRAESLYATHRAHFSTESTVWGFYLANAESVTDDLRTIATQRFAALGLSTQHTYYDTQMQPIWGQSTAHTPHSAMARRV